MLRGRARMRRSRAARRRSPSPARSARAPRRGRRSTRSARAAPASASTRRARPACARRSRSRWSCSMFDDIGRAYVNLSDCVDQAGRIDEAARLALDGFEAGRSLGLGTGLPRDAAERGGAAQVPRRALGRRRAAGGSGARAASGRARGGGRARDRRPDRGRARRSRRRAGRASRVRARSFKTDASAMWTAPVDAAAAELELSAGRAAAARDLVARALARSRGPGVSVLHRPPALGRSARGGRARGGGARAVRPDRRSATRGPGPRT